MRKKVTSTDIAKAAGVSQATVSMVLNKKYNVSFSKETIERVEQAAKELGYTVPRQRSRKSGKNSRLIVVFCPTLTNPYYVMLLQGIETVAKEKGYGVFVCNTQRELKIEEQYLRMMHSVSPAGIIYTCNPSNTFMEQVEEIAAKIPLVVISNRDKVKVDAISQDNTKVGSLMARHLLDLGHREVAFIAPPLTKRQEQRSRRVEGFVREYEKEGLSQSVMIKAADDIWDEVLPSVDSEYRIGYNLTRELLAETRKVTAIAGLNDMIAFGIIDALQEEKLKVPNDVSVIGCDNIIFGRMSQMSLTTIEHFVPLKGRDACDIIMRKIESAHNPYIDMEPTSTYHIEYEPKLIVRKTTAYVKQEPQKKRVGKIIK
nr:LacI family DNA-binding transcriptional regulator [uncultured Blautia sp.]